jgi:hypothetical protein
MYGPTGYPLYADPVVFAHHGLTMCNDAHLIKGVCELDLARCANAEKTTNGFACPDSTAILRHERRP